MSYKKSSHKALTEYRKSHSMEQTIAVARKMLLSESHRDNHVFTSHVHGEICETILELIVHDYIAKFPIKTKNWFDAKGLIIKDINRPDSGYFTELDYTVFTPQKVFAFECKSYNGDKKIIDKCTIRRKTGGSFDVYAQHERHAAVLADQLRPFRKRQFIEKPAYQLVLFDFSIGDTIDTRTTSNKLLMPCLNEKNVLNIFQVYEQQPVIWNMEYLKKAIEIIQKRQVSNTEKHLKYVKGIKRK